MAVPRPTCSLLFNASNGFLKRISRCFRRTLQARGGRPPFSRVKYAADLGEEVCAFGYPPNLMWPDRDKNTLRFFRGTVQRPFLFELHGRRYSAFELSFACP